MTQNTAKLVLQGDQALLFGASVQLFFMMAANAVKKVWTAAMRAVCTLRPTKA